MAIVVIKHKVTSKDVEKAQEEYGKFVKVVADIKSNVIAIGGEWHADAEKKLLELGSQQENLWGGSVDLESQKIDAIALINIRPNQGNDSQEVIDPKIRKKLIEIIKEKFDL